MTKENQPCKSTAASVRGAFVALAIAAFAAAPARADSPTTGKCGDDVYWTFYPDQSKLVIEGVGKMYDYSVSEEKWGRNLDNPDSSIVVEIGEGVTSVGEYAFSNCQSITSVNLPDSLTDIGPNAFNMCVNLPSIYFPKGVKTIGTAAFAACSKLASIDVAVENPNFQSHEGVLYTKGLTELIQCPANKGGSYSLPDGVKVIMADSFRESKLESVKLPDSLETIERCAFWLCDNLARLEIPKNVKSIGYQMVYVCPKFQAFVVDPDNKDYASEDGVLFDKNMTRLLIYPQAKSGDSYECYNKHARASFQCNTWLFRDSA